jgi:hypothetical protein
VSEQLVASRVVLSLIEFKAFSLAKNTGAVDTLLFKFKVMCSVCLIH